MAIIQRTCPHCGHEKVAFASMGEWNIDDRGGRKGVSFQCGGCHRGLIAEFEMSAAGGGTVHGQNRAIDGLPGFDAVAEYPKAPAIDCPAHTPEKAAMVFLEAKTSLRARHWNSAGMSGRRALEFATVALRPDDAGFRTMKLVARINALAVDHEITPAMKQWAHAIRIDGNDAAHDDDLFSEEQATQLMAFTEVFLQYAFTLPALVAARQAGKD